MAILALFALLAMPAAARAEKEREARAVDLPAGTAELADAEIRAGNVGEQIRVKVDLSEDPGDAALRVTLPARWDRVTGTPHLTDDASGRVDADAQGRTVTVDLDRARSGDDPTLAIADRGIPAGTYELPVRWVGPDGQSGDAGELRLVVEAGERENERPDWNRVEEQRLEENASSDAAEESETFDAVGPWDSDRLMAAANKGGDIAGGFFLSNDAGRTFSELHFSTSLAIPGGGVQGPSQLGGDPILAQDDLGNIWAGGLTVPTCADGFASRIFVERVPAGGSSFISPGVALPTRGDDVCSANTLQDKPMMTIDRYPSSPTYGRLYVTWDDPEGGGVNVVVSSCDTRPGGFPNAANCDNPDNWSAPIPVSGATPGSFISSDPAVGPDGRAYVVWWDYAGPGAGGNAIKISSCAAASAPDCRAGGWSTPAVVAQLTTDGSDNEIPFACPTPAQPGGRVGEVPSIDVAPDGRLYVSWSDLRTNSGSQRCPQTQADYVNVGNAQSWDSFVATAPSLGDLLAAANRSSTDVGARVVSDNGSGTTDNSDEWFPWVAVDRTNGQASVDYYSSKLDSTRKKSNFFLRSVGPGSGTQASFGTEQQVSTAPGDYSGTICCNAQGPTFANDYGDYTGLAAAEGNTFPIWTRRANSGDDGEEVVNVPDAPSPQLVLDAGTVSDAPGDGDGALEPGEPFSLTLRLRDTGPAGATNLRGTLLAPAGGATIDNTATFGDVGSGGTTDGSNAFDGRIAPGVPCGVSVGLRLDVATDQGPESVPVLLPVTCAGGFAPPAPPPTQTVTTPVTVPTAPATRATTAPSPRGKVTVVPQRLSTVLRRGLAARASCTRTCTMRLTLLLPPPKGKRATTIMLGRLTVRNLRSAKTVRVRLGRTARRRLRSSHRKRLQLQVVMTTAAGGRQATTVTVTLR